MTPLHRHLRLLAPLLAVVSVLAGGLLSAAPASAAVVARTGSPAPACSSPFAAGLTALQPENRVKGFLPADLPRTGSSTSVLPNSVRGLDLFLRFSTSGVTVYVNSDPVNLVDPNGHAACAGNSADSCMTPGRNGTYSTTQISAAAIAAGREPVVKGNTGTLSLVCIGGGTAPEGAPYGGDCSFVDPAAGPGAANYLHDCATNGRLDQVAGADPAQAVTCGVAFSTGYDQVGGAQFCVSNCDALHAYNKFLAQQYGTLGSLETAGIIGSSFLTGPDSAGIGALVEREAAGQALSFGSGREAETTLEQLVGGKGQEGFDVQGFANRRIVDVVSGNVGFESKVGYVTLDSDIRSQIARDGALLQSGQLGDYVWVFGRSAQTGRVGASQGVLDLLEQNGIRYTTFDDFYP